MSLSHSEEANHGGSPAELAATPENLSASVTAAGQGSTQERKREREPALPQRWDQPPDAMPSLSMEQVKIARLVDVELVVVDTSPPEAENGNAATTNREEHGEARRKVEVTGAASHSHARPLVSFPPAPVARVAATTEAGSGDSHLSRERTAGEGPVLSPRPPPVSGPTSSLTSPATPSQVRVPSTTPRKTPVSTPGSSSGNPTPPVARSPASLANAAVACLHPTPAAADSRRAARVARWADLLLPAMMLERAAHEEAATKEVCMRIADAIPGDRQEAKDAFLMLLVNLKDPKNGALRKRIVDGDLPVEVLVTLGERELANPERRRDLDEQFEARAKDTNLVEIRKATMTSSTLFPCPKCRARDCTWTQKQTRSGDEPMTVFCTCNKCGNVWKKY